MFCSILIFISSVLRLTDDRRERNGKEAAAVPRLKTVSPCSLTAPKEVGNIQWQWLADTTQQEVTPDAWYNDLLHNLNWRIIHRPAALQTNSSTKCVAEIHI